ncbi:MAG: TadE/TadG family type IV pilus assembly protein [Bdellovibrionales bacterium]
MLIGHRKRFASSLNKARRGVVSVEFALVLPVFIFLLVGIIEMSMMLLAAHLIENAVYNASRTAKTGYVIEGKSQIETVMGVIKTRLSGLSPLIDQDKLSVSWMSYGDLSSIGQPDQGTESMGTPSQIVVYTISYPWKPFTPLIGDLIGDDNGLIKLSSRIVVRNEPYD